MRSAMQGKCHPPRDKNRTPITNPIPPYGSSGDQSQDLNPAALIKELIEGSFSGTIPHIDVWGEGRIMEPNHVTGFPTSFNINLNQGITLPAYKYHGHAIPNLLPVCQYDDDFDVIPSGCVQVITMMGAPLHKNIANEIAKIINPKGVVALFGYTHCSKEVKTLDSILSKKNFQKDISYQLGEQFQSITLEPIIVFSSNENPEADLTDDL